MKKFNKVLLVDDDDISNFLTEIIIQKMNFTEDLHISRNGEEALNFIKNCMNHKRDDYPELVLLDINMPVMDGFEFLEEFKKLQAVIGKDISFVILTTSNYKNDVEKAKKYNVAGYLNKPITEEKIKGIISELS